MPAIHHDVSQRALVQRLNRILKPDTLRRTRGQGRLAVWYIQSADGRVIESGLDPVELAREIGVLRAFEHLVTTPTARPLVPDGEPATAPMD